MSLRRLDRMRRAVGMGSLLLLSNHITTPKIVCAVVLSEESTDIGALDRRIRGVLELFERSDTTTGEAELKEMAEKFPSYAPAPFYLGLLSHNKDELETAVGFYVATLHADPTHVDATNNLGAALSALPPSDRRRVAEAIGLLQLMEELDKTSAWKGFVNGETDEVSRPDAVDRAVEGLYTRALDLQATHRWALNNLGLHLHARNRNDEALHMFSQALEIYPGDVEIGYNLGVTLQALGKAQRAAQSFASVLNLDSQHAGAALNLAALHHRYGKPSNAIEHYRRAAEIIDPGDIDMMVMMRNNLGTALFQIGRHTLAKAEHIAVLELLGQHDRNLPKPQDVHAKNDLYIDTLVNLHRARKASCDWHDWEKHIFVLKDQVDTQQLGNGRPSSLLPFDTLLLPYPVTPAWRRKIAESHSMRYVETSPTSSRPNKRVGDKVHMRGTMNGAGCGGRADEKGEGIPRVGGCRETANTSVESARHTARTEGARPSLNIGFIGNDFDEHPTARMIEGIFVWKRRLTRTSGDGDCVVKNATESDTSAHRLMTNLNTPTAVADCCRYSVYSYGGVGQHSERDGGSGGNNTSSRTRESIRACASSFFDIYAEGHGESIDRIKADDVDILVDLQGHTLGGRGEIAAARPARIQVNYLIYPGTSGAPYTDYLLTDRYVTPPEHAQDYSESLVYLPRTYQANWYEDLASAGAAARATSTENELAMFRREQGLPGDPSVVVFANFNKVDKLDPESFFLWTQIMRRVPGSVLWLLEASAADEEKEAIRRRLQNEARSQGIDGSRIVWAKRVSKSEHLRRHIIADLFLDTLTYGAHSTATDALAGGLPFLTMAGDSFASRVGVSLLHNAGRSQSTLLVGGQREYEDLAVELVSTSRGRKILRKLRESLTEGVAGYPHSSWTREGEDIAEPTESRAGAQRDYNSLPIFDTEAITKDLDRAFMLMSDVHDARKDCFGEELAQNNTRLPHIVLTGRSNEEFSAQA